MSRAAHTNHTAKKIMVQVQNNNQQRNNALGQINRHTVPKPVRYSSYSTAKR